jgi:hypothetical protein
MIPKMPLSKYLLLLIPFFILGSMLGPRFYDPIIQANADEALSRIVVVRGLGFLLIAALLFSYMNFVEGLIRIIQRRK